MNVFIPVTPVSPDTIEGSLSTNYEARAQLAPDASINPPALKVLIDPSFRMTLKLSPGARFVPMNLPNASRS